MERARVDADPVRRACIDALRAGRPMPVRAGWKSLLRISSTLDGETAPREVRRGRRASMDGEDGTGNLGMLIPSRLRGMLR
jgi:hypothetical protein